MAAPAATGEIGTLPAWQQRLFPLAIALLRVTFGLLFLSNGLAKLPGLDDLDYAPFPGFLIDYEGAENSLEHDSSNHPIPIYRDFVQDVMLENFTPFGVALVIVEIGAGTLLLLGAFSSAAALVGFFSIFHIWFLNWGRYADRSLWAWEGPIEWLPLLALCFMAAGRFYGLDRLVARNLPERLRRWPLVG
jgi:uncharacterized membrane protein YphA (DoxX/SURF4 family)